MCIRDSSVALRARRQVPLQAPHPQTEKCLERNTWQPFNTCGSDKNHPRNSARRHPFKHNLAVHASG
eukprot:14169749-Alexandrium_andersonii.AAC.1